MPYNEQENIPMKNNGSKLQRLGLACMLLAILVVFLVEVPLLPGPWWTVVILTAVGMILVIIGKIDPDDN